MKKHNARNYILMIMAMLFWGASFIFIKITYKYIGPVTMIFFRLVIASTLLFIVDRIIYKSKIDRNDYKLFFMLGFTEPFLYFIGEGYGMQFVSSTQASVIIATIPVFAMIAGVLLYKDKLSKINTGGVVISFLGILLIIGKDGLRDSVVYIGFALMFLAVLAAVANSLIIYRLGGKYSSFTIITYQNLVGAILFLPMFFILEFNSLSAGIFKGELILSILFLAIFPSVLSFLFYISVLKRLGVARTSVFSNLIPIVTGVLAFFMLGESFTLMEISGIVVVITGLYMSQQKNVIPYEG